MIVSGSKQGGDVETREPQTQGLCVNSCSSLSLNFLVYFAEMPKYFSMKTNKRKVRKCLNKSSSAAKLAASSDRLGPHGSVQVSTIISHHQLQNLLPRRTGYGQLKGAVSGLRQLFDN